MEKIYVLKEVDLDKIKVALSAAKTLLEEHFKGSIMESGVVCDHDDNFMCSCRLENFISFFESKCIN